MMAVEIDRRQKKAESRALLRDAQVSEKSMVGLFLALNFALSVLMDFGGGAALFTQESPSLVGIFSAVLSFLLSLMLGIGFTLYCMAVRRGERAEYLTLFDGFSFAGRIIGLYLVVYIFVVLWSMLFLIPGIIAAYRYRWAFFNLCEHPELGVLEALRRSKRQTFGYKAQLFFLDLSYLGWAILGNLPSLLFGIYLGYTGQAALASSLPVSLGSALWSSIILFFYIAPYRVTELGYFEIAKQTSGADGTQTPPSADSPENF